MLVKHNAIKVEYAIIITIINWNGEDENGIKQPSGVYYINLSTNSISKFKKMLLVK